MVVVPSAKVPVLAIVGDDWRKVLDPCNTASSEKVVTPPPSIVVPARAIPPDILEMPAKATIA
jgi:hypothetical protein